MLRIYPSRAALDRRVNNMPYEQRAVELAEYRNFCRCTEDHQFDQRCDGTRCVGQEQAIKAALTPNDEMVKAALRVYGATPLTDLDWMRKVLTAALNTAHCGDSNG